MTIDRDFFIKQGKRGGKARARKLTAKQRREIARRAAEARWRKPKAGEVRSISIVPED